MEQKRSPTEPKQAIVRIYSDAGKFFGTGCLEIGGLIVTCAHVIRDVFKLTEMPTDAPAGKVKIDFPFLGREPNSALPRYDAEVAPVGWGPARGVELANDIAILRPLMPLPLCYGCGFVAVDALNADLSVFVHGFIDGHTEGDARACLPANGIRSDGVLWVDTDNAAYLVNPGFSGAPVFPTNTGLHIGHAVGMLVGKPKMNKVLSDDGRVAYIIPASRIHAQIEAVFRAEAAEKAENIPEELAVARAYVPALRTSLEQLPQRGFNNAGPFIDGVTRILGHFETLAAEPLDNLNIMRLAGMVGNLDRHARKAADCGFDKCLTLFCLHDFCDKLGKFGEKLREHHPNMTDKNSIPNDLLLEEKLPHWRELNDLRKAINDRLRALEANNLPIPKDIRKQARNALMELDEALDLDPLLLGVIDGVRRELEELDRSLFAELIVASQLLLGRYVELLPDLAVFRDFREGPEMVIIPAGKFLMGSTENEEGRDDDESPQHEVKISKRFAVGRYPVTFDEWDLAVASGGCNGYQPEDQGWGRRRRPVINVKWEDAQSYIAWLKQKTKKDYRLLSEAEWEYCCRARTTTRYSFGDDEGMLGEYAWHNDNSDDQTHPVGEKKPNPWGLYDVHGNVYEWVEDVWHESYTGAPTDGTPWTDGNNQGAHVVRGGSWYFSNPRDLRSAFRFGFDAVNHDLNIGFRLARTLSPLAP